MFDRFQRLLHDCGVTVTSFGANHIDSLWQTKGGSAYSPATQMRYLKLLDRLCRHLVYIGMRDSNPAKDLVHSARWPNEDPTPIYLPPEADGRLQAWVQPSLNDDLAQLRARAIVALFLGTGITAAEGRGAIQANLQTAASPPHLRVPRRGARDARTVSLPQFAVPILETWSARRATHPIAGNLLFSLTSLGRPITDMGLGRIVRSALVAIEFEADDMSPRILRNTFCRRQLLAGLDRIEVSELLGLVSTRTADRIAATVGTD
ncbi:site-specific integrase [Cupriavidus sp. WS]|uniref:tyrosine-type recombinase/integrase n=1 Tax=Cupriavidus sp. WS TaxID=1312922 RepID=UPI00036F519F|nr:site-specific integrase [Cupriavidus sp. WS]